MFIPTSNLLLLAVCAIGAIKNDHRLQLLLLRRFLLLFLFLRFLASRRANVCVSDEAQSMLMSMIKIKPDGRIRINAIKLQIYAIKSFAFASSAADNRRNKSKFHPEKCLFDFGTSTSIHHFRFSHKDEHRLGQRMNHL